MNDYEEQDFSSEKFSIGIWKKIIKLVVKKKRNFIVLIVSVIGLALLDIIYPLLNQYAIEQYFEKGDFSTMYYFIAAFALVALGYGVTVLGFIRTAGIVEVEVGYELRHEAFVNLQNLPFAYYDKTPAGWIMARLTSDSRKLATIISWGLVDMLWGGLTMIGIIIVMYVINWKLALVVTCVVPFLVVVSLYFRKKILVSYRGVRKVNSKITASYNEGILGNKTTKTLVLEDNREKEFNELCTSMKRNSIRALTYSAVFFPILLVISYTAVAITLRVGGGMVLTGTITVATLYLFVSYTTQFFDPIMQIARILADLQQAQASAERILALIETKPEIYDTPEVIEKYGTILEPKKENWEELNGDIEFKNVTFRYIPEETILDNFNLKIKKGTSVAIVGPTGAGKSTIVNLVCRFYEPTTGQILIDGRDYKERSISWLHNNLGYVLQTPHLFNGTIRENIAYGHPEIPLEEVIKASKAVSAHSFIEKLEQGYDTVVGEGGAKLSVGERQLISFARAILANPRILILDEATSSIDTNTEALIQDAINTIMKGRTTFIVAHRLSTIRNADLILVLHNGQIIEQGNHKELLEKQGEYYNLYKTQFLSEQMEKTKY